MMRMSASLALPVLAAAALVTAGCAASAGADPANPSKPTGPSASASASAAAPSTPGKPALVGTQWRLKSDPQAWFRVLGSNISGNDSCNTLNGTAASLASADRVDFGAGLAATQKFCPDPKGTQTAISEALKGERVWTRNGSELVLTDPDNNRTWTFVLTSAAPSSASATPTASTLPATSAAPSPSAAPLPR